LLLEHQVNKAISILALTSLLISCLFTQGCVGIAVYGVKEQAFEPARLQEKPGIHAVARSSSSNEETTTVWLREHWGQPSSMARSSRSGEDEIWTYKFNHSWCGIMPYIVIPIPLVLPVGKERVVFYVHDGRVGKAIVTKRGGFQAIAGFGPDGPGAWSSSF